ncbi:hypothetical protein Csp1_23360 [Corynebacterium provencense]|uniref:Uncharacterized protein n=1 Tax=Corynebacterium provencense TaxID=1737425 RepID=A0A2Z3YQL8_9CORY|nr:hypothetical protein Csp1_23360 [Corynebacterium provencense]
MFSFCFFGHHRQMDTVTVKVWNELTPAEAYVKFRFVTVGGEFEEAGIPHITMVRH